MVETLATPLGLFLNPSKCTTLHLSGVTPVGMWPTVFRVSGGPVAALSDSEPLRYLGRPVAFRLPQQAGTNVIDDEIRSATAIFSSLLAPWQRIDALKTFVFPALHFSMRPIVKRTLYLPVNASTNYVYGSASGGAIAIPVAAELYDICRIDSAFKLLTTPDQSLRDLALSDAYEIASTRLGCEATRYELKAYLSGNLQVFHSMLATQLCSVWTEAPKASRRLQVSLSLRPDHVTITCGDATLPSTQRNRVMRTLRDVLAHVPDNALHDQPNQGKVMACVSADRASSHFITTGAFTHFADRQFIHRARLNLLPLNGAVMWGPSNRDQRCRVCGYAREMLPHVLCHCMTHSAMSQARHNAVVSRLRTAATRDYTMALENRLVSDTGLCPDLVLVRGKEALEIDVACPFENTPEAFTNTRNYKLTRYQPVADYLRRRYQRVTVAAVIVGALGAWDPANDRVLLRLYSRSYLRLMKKLCVSEVVAASRTIYHAHMGHGRS
ncbi:uncharacterized protein T26G10.4-like [Rhipicephalus microplus]|uniref:uncharacterized protein T26G10.4-like n=1 Tax=Rhipicephalus microplus TaxID=6941 RepID=UPI003F6D9959